MNPFLHRLPLLCFLFTGLCLMAFTATATHIIGGEITARRLDAQSLTFEITVRGYTDASSGVGFSSNGVLDFGDGTVMDLINNGNNVIPTRISEGVWVHEFKITHTYPTGGTYTISFRELYRNSSILNIENSSDTPFYAETAIKIDSFLGPNSSPVFTRPPVETAFAGKTYHHQPGATDPDGDSLSYRLVRPLQDRSTQVLNYRFPHRVFPQGDSRNGTQELGGTPAFTINPYSGDISWDAPGTTGEYTIAFAVDEWREVNGQYYLMGYVVRDMLVKVVDAEADLYPQLSMPFSSARVNPTAGEAVSWTITATAPSPSDSVVLELWGDFLPRSGATISSSRVRATGEASITISWTGEADLGQHYQLIARSYFPEQPQHTRNRITTLYYDPASPLGLNDSKISTATIFPNPLAESTFFISIPETAGKKAVLQVFDMKGSLVHRQTFAAFEEQQAVALPGAKQGMYLVHLACQGQVYRSKLVVQ
ncbi:T9SS type A sorting domain-containing protein [Cesiribacter sp. SM1]|uniref:T9SS type A sorting domain-containing protein n=1 Tax=Cesiribacter sp. SM1 TaxID=2861196 RepID=UPI001CD7ADFD|nr:T9SS type A sorting domain-containing protein [Cesiribacter sp. SM1]